MSHYIINAAVFVPVEFARRSILPMRQYGCVVCESLMTVMCGEIWSFLLLSLLRFLGVSVVVQSAERTQ